MKPSELVKVKALEWWDWVAFPFQQLEWSFIVYPAGGNYCRDCMWEAVYENESGELQTRIGVFPTKADAKAACQAHYESMILALLDSK